MAVQVEVIPAVEEVSAQSSSSPESGRVAGAGMDVVLTMREHATILAALRYVARRGGFRNTEEVDIATNVGQWDAMDPDEIDELGDRFNVRPSSGGEE